jgi:hypothetical protein
LVDFGEDPDNREFAFEISIQEKALFEAHFHPLPISTFGQIIPNIVKRRFQMLV